MKSLRLASVFLLGCTAFLTCVPPDGTDLFRSAVAQAPGGALLSVWLDPSANPSPGDARGYLAGGLLGVDTTSLPDGLAGRLIRYTDGTFTTVCRTSAVLWWVAGLRESGTQTVYASGEYGTVLRYRNGTCESLSLGMTFPDGAPTLWGILPLGPNDVWFVGSVPSSLGSDGVVFRYDGASFVSLALPQETRGKSLFKLALARDNQGVGRAVVAVGAGGLVLEYSLPNGPWTLPSTGVRTADNRLFTVSCSETSARCFAVGGAASALVLRAESGVWSSVASTSGVVFDTIPGLSGVSVLPSGQAFVVGNQGVTSYMANQSAWVPPSAPTAYTLHGVSAVGTRALAVGGDFSNPTRDQKGVILVRGDNAASFTLDGATFVPTGTLRERLDP